MIVDVFRLIDVKVETPFRRLSYDEAIRRFGSDKPDTRFALELVDLSGALGGTEFAPYRAALEARGQVKAINVKGGSKYSRKTLDELTELAKRFGASGLAWIKSGDTGGLSSSLSKALGEDKVAELARIAGFEAGDCVLIVAGKAGTVAASLSALRLEVGQREGLIDQN
jgi:aspartyl-tRNA synthetase